MDANAAMTADSCNAVPLLARILAVTRARRLLASDRPGAGPLTRPVRAAIRSGVLTLLARRLAASPTSAHRDIAALLARAIEAGDGASALALAGTAGRRPDRRAEKVLSRRYRALWICNPKAASRSIIAALRAADPDALLIRGRTVDEVYARYPEAKEYWSFAFLRHPCDRTLSFYADKHLLARRDPDNYRWFIEPWHGLATGMSFSELCRWLDTAAGSDAFADRHWLSQSRQIAGADGRLPDFLGRCETLDDDWRTVAERLGLPLAALPRLNQGDPRLLAEARPDRECAALLRSRYADDFALGGYGDALDPPPR